MPETITTLLRSLSASWQDHPSILAARMTHLEIENAKRRQEVAEVSHRVTVLEHEPEPQTIETPMGRLPVPLVILLVLWLIIYKPDIALKFFGL